MSLPEQLLKDLLVCPNTGHQTTGDHAISHPIPRGWAVWWRCSGCHRWHMVEVVRKVLPAVS